MSAASDFLRTYITDLLPTWRVQFGRWTDSSRADRYVVIKPVGGLPAALVRQPQFTLSVIGADGDSDAVPEEACEILIEALRMSAGPSVAFIQPAEPVFLATDDGRPVFEIAISAITT